MLDPKTLFKSCYQIAIEAAKPERKLKALLPSPPKGKLVVIGAGKGASQLAQSFENLYSHEIEGVVVTRYGFGVKCKNIKILEAAHPVPDKNSYIAAQKILHSVKGLCQDDVVVACITGGGSALLASPLPPMTLKDEIEINKSLLASGAPISAMNIIRAHLSSIKGGRLAKAASPARVISYIISDVPKDDPAEVASGPTVLRNSIPEDALVMAKKYNIPLPANALSALQSQAAFCPHIKGEVHILGSATQSLAAVKSYLEMQGHCIDYLGDDIEGETRQVAKEHAGRVKHLKNQGFKGIILSGGETTVTLTGSGKGGRNSEYLLALAIELDGMEDVYAFAADTDGIDGSEDNAGAFIDEMTLKNMQVAGINPKKYLENNDAYNAFKSIDALFTPGPSGTNVNDLRIILMK